VLTDHRLRCLRLAAQRLTPATAVTTARAAVHDVVGVQAQDVRAAGLALRSRVASLRRADLGTSAVNVLMPWLASRSGLPVSTARRRVAIEWFGAPAESAELDAEKAAVETYLHGA
jgi:hypothetical protein